MLGGATEIFGIPQPGSPIKPGAIAAPRPRGINGIRMNLVRELRKHRAKHFSQNGEDGVIERLLKIVGIANKFYVEIGAGSGIECNTRWLRENGWSGIMLDRDHSDPALPLYRELVTAENVNDLLLKYNVPDTFDLLSIDIDGNDYWVWKATMTRFRPRVIVVEFNAALPIAEAVTMPYDPDHQWAGQSCVGQSLLASKKLGEQYGYSLVYAAPPNAFLVLRSLLPREYVEVSAVDSLGSALLAILVRLAPPLMRFQEKRWRKELRKFPWIQV